MKFTVEVEGFYLEDQDLQRGLQEAIKRDVISQMRDLVKTQVTSLVDNYLKVEIEKELSTRVKLICDDFIQNGQMKDRYNEKNMKPVKEWIAETFRAQTSDWHNAILKAVQAQGIELKNRYDLMFATQIINKVKEIGFLKDGVADILLSSEKQ